MLSIYAIVIKSGSNVDPVYELGHWVSSSTNGSLVEPHGQIKKIKYI